MLYSNKNPCKIHASVKKKSCKSFSDIDSLSICSCIDWLVIAFGILAPENFRVIINMYHYLGRLMYLLDSVLVYLFSFALMVSHLIIKEQQDLEELLSQK